MSRKPLVTPSPGEVARWRLAAEPEPLFNANPRVCWHRRFASAACIACATDIPGMVLVLSKDASNLLLTRHYSSKGFSEEYTTTSDNPSPTVEEVANKLVATSAAISFAAYNVLTQELKMAAKNLKAGKEVETKDEAKTKAAAKIAAAGKEPAKAEKVAKPAKAGKESAAAADKPAKEPKVKSDKPAGKPAMWGEDSAFVALVKEDDEGVKMQDGSARTSVFRAFAKAGKAGTTIGSVMKETKQELAAVRGALRVLVAQNRIAAKAK